MGSSAKDIAVEIVWIRGNTGSKQDLVASFKKMFDLSTKVANEDKSEPALGLKPYDNIVDYPDDSCMLLYWNSVEQHDTLAAHPKFEAGCAKLMTDEVLPKLREPIESFYVHSASSELVLSDACCVEIIEIQSSSLGSDDELVKRVDESLGKIAMPQGFLGSYSGPRSNSPDTFVIVTKWSSKNVFQDASWNKQSEEGLLALFPQQARIAKRWQMYA